MLDIVNRGNSFNHSDLSEWTPPTLTEEEVTSFAKSGTLPKSYSDAVFLSISSSGNGVSRTPGSVFVRDFENDKFLDAIVEAGKADFIGLAAKITDRISRLKREEVEPLSRGDKIFTVRGAEGGSFATPVASVHSDSLTLDLGGLVTPVTGAKIPQYLEDPSLPSHFQGRAPASRLLISFLNGEIAVDRFDSSEMTRFFGSVFNACGTESQKIGQSELSRECGVLDIYAEIRRFVRYIHACKYALIRAEVEEKDKATTVLKFVDVIRELESPTEASSAKVGASRSCETLVKDILRNEQFLETNPILASKLYELHWAILEVLNKPERQDTEVGRNKETRQQQYYNQPSNTVFETAPLQFSGDVLRIWEIKRPEDRIRAAAELALRWKVVPEDACSTSLPVRTVYLNLLRALHPDTQQSSAHCNIETAQELFKALSEAWQRLKKS